VVFCYGIVFLRRKECEQEIKEFYQSESEHSDDDKDDPDWNEDDEKEEGNKDEEAEASKDTDTAAAEDGSGKQSKEDEDTENKTEDIEAGPEDEADKLAVEDVQSVHETVEDEGAKVAPGGNDGAEQNIVEEVEQNTGAVKVANKTSEEAEMHTLEVTLDDELRDQSKIEGAVTSERLLGDEKTRLASKEEDSNKEEIKEPVKNEVSSNHERKDDIEDKFEEMAEKEDAKSGEPKATESCPIDSQDVRLKYSEDLTESFGSKNRPSNMSTSSDSDDDDEAYEVLIILFYFFIEVHLDYAIIRTVQQGYQ